MNPDDAAWTRTVASDSVPGHHYTVSLRQGIYACSCPGWRQQRSPLNRRTCKHLIRLLGETHERQRAPESFFGLTRVKRKAVRPSPVPHMQYQTWRPEKTPPTRFDQWFYSLKLNGAFGRWANGQLVTKTGRRLQPPARLVARLPRDLDLDGEIYHADLQKVRRAVLADQWDDDVEFVVFDVFHVQWPFAQRWAALQRAHEHHRFKMVPQHVFRAAEWPALERRVREQQEEGLVLRDPAGRYEPGRRSATTLKWKPWSTGTARLLAVEPRPHGTRLTLRESDTAPDFRIYVAGPAAAGWLPGSTLTFAYSGRTDHGRPESAQLKAPDARVES